MIIRERVEQYRIVVGLYASNPGDPFGAFEMPGPCGERLTIIATDGVGTDWEHVSVSTHRKSPSGLPRQSRIPNWTEMAFVKNLFWDSEQCVVQFHPPASEYINNYSVVLHLWRWKRGDFPIPPSWLVGVKGVELA